MGISQECQHRAKCLTAPAEIAKRARKEEEIKLELKRKADQDKAKDDQKCSQDQAMVDQMCSFSNLDLSKENVAKCELENFGQFKAPELRAFILAHSTKTSTQVSHLKRPQDCKALDDAKAGIVNCVSVAFVIDAGLYDDTNHI